jgi:hypothetical protein
VAAGYLSHIVASFEESGAGGVYHSRSAAVLL